MLKLPDISLTEAEELWIRTIYKRYMDNLPFDYRSIRAELWGNVPGTFDQWKIDRRLIRGDRELTLLGIARVENNEDFILECDKAIASIRETLLSDTSTKTVTAEALATRLGVTAEVTERILGMIMQYQGFSSQGTENGTGRYSSIEVNEDRVFDRYFSYQGPQQLIDELEPPSYREPVFSQLLGQTAQESGAFQPIFKSKIDKIDTKLCFVLMPFTEEWSDRVYRKLLRPAIEKLGLQCLRADNLTGQIVIEDIWAKINQSAFIIADVTKRNPNVMYELGIVHTIGKPAILITQDMSTIPFDFAHLRHYAYDDNIDGFAVLVKKLPRIIDDIYKECYPHLVATTALSENFGQSEPPPV